MSTYLIIGGTGKVGRRLSEILRSRGHTVVVASRSGADVHFDWREPASYRSGVTGVDGVFLVGPGSATDWSDLLTELLAEASRAGVRQAVAGLGDLAEAPGWMDRDEFFGRVDLAVFPSVWAEPKVDRTLPAGDTVST